MNIELRAFLDLIAWSEGTSIIAGSDDGYNVLVTGITPTIANVTMLPNGKLLFKSYADHPNILVRLNAKLLSTAAGRYQQMHHDWPIYKERLGLRDFGKASQDALAVQHIRECRALDRIAQGDIAGAIAACSKIWASFPGNSYGQPTRPIDTLLTRYALCLKALQP